MKDHEIAANLMAATAHLLVGAADRHDALNQNVAIILGAEPVNGPTLVHWGDWVQRGGRPIIYLAFEGRCAVPAVTLVCVTDGQTLIFENCLLWQRRSGGAAMLIPDSFDSGSYSVDAELRLAHHDRPPVLSARAARDGMIRACRTLARIEKRQIEDGLTFKSPVRLERRAA